MLRFAARAERAWSAVPAAWRLLLVVLAVGVLMVLSVTPTLASDSSTTNPFRWK